MRGSNTSKSRAHPTICVNSNGGRAASPEVDGGDATIAVIDRLDTISMVGLAAWSSARQGCRVSGEWRKRNATIAIMQFFRSRVNLAVEGSCFPAQFVGWSPFQSPSRGSRWCGFYRHRTTLGADVADCGCYMKEICTHRELPIGLTP